MANTRVVAGGHEGDGGHGGRGIRMRWGGDLGCEGETKRARGRTGASGEAEQVEGEPEASPLSSPGEAGEVVGVDLAPVATRSRGTGRGGSDR